MSFEALTNLFSTTPAPAASAGGSTAPTPPSSTAASVALGLQVAGTVGSALSAYSKAKAENAFTSYQAAVQRNNAELAERQARSALVAGARDEVNSRLRQAALTGKQRASYAARGIDLTEGSALNALTDTELMGTSDALTIRDNTNRTAWGYRANAAMSEADADILEARSRRTSPLSSAFSTLLTGATGVAGNWYQLSKAGALK